MSYLLRNIGIVSSVVRVKLDSSGLTIAESSTEYAGYKYTITLTSHRRLHTIPTVINAFTFGTPTVTITSIQTSTAPIGGTYQLNLGD